MKVEFVEPLYKVGFSFWYDKDQKKMCEEASRRFGEQLPVHNGAGRTISGLANGRLFIYIFIDSEYSLHEPFAIGAVAHEALHAAHEVFRNVGAITDYEHDEPLAYYVEFIAREYMTRMQKRGKKQ